ncbi:hypothetical protein [Cytobacillus sp. FSL R5-0596]|uniref:hypothetical protein n=1 Tax=Cytobacillus sp. FSL R5-0596 TaxID=2954696 RepID=UPI0030FB185C
MFNSQTQNSTGIKNLNSDIHDTLMVSRVYGGDYMEELSITLVIASIMVLGYFIGYTIIKA